MSTALQSSDLPLVLTHLRERIGVSDKDGRRLFRNGHERHIFCQHKAKVSDRLKHYKMFKEYDTLSLICKEKKGLRTFSWDNTKHNSYIFCEKGRFWISKTFYLQVLQAARNGVRKTLRDPIIILKYSEIFDKYHRIHLLDST